MLTRVAAAGAMLSCAAAASETAGAQTPYLSQGSGHGGWFDAKQDFQAMGDGTTDDAHALQSAINTGSEQQRPIRLPPGAYKILHPLTVPPNTMLIGSGHGVGFGCRIEPVSCPAFIIGGATESFHCAIENIMIWPSGTAPDYLISIDNSYSVTFRNIRLHNAQEKLARGAVLLLGEAGSGGHGRCNDIIWDNLIVRNDTGQPPIAILAAKGCGTHRFISPALENYRTLLEWQGGQLDLVTPYTERAGRYAVNCNVDVDEHYAYLNTFGGTIDCANSGLGCAIRATTRNFNSFGTQWGGSADNAVYFYELPAGVVNFYGVVPNLSRSGKGRYSGVAGWRRFINFSQQTLKGWRSLQTEIPPQGETRTEVTVPGAAVGEYWARVTANVDLRKTQISAYVSDADTVTVVTRNPTEAKITLSGVFAVECGAT